MRWFKILSVFSFIVLAYWLSELGRPLVHCHTSGLIEDIRIETESGNFIWSRCDWVDFVSLRPTLQSEAEIQNWKRQLESLKPLERILPALIRPPRVFIKTKDPYFYRIAGHQIEMGSAIAETEPLFLRGVLQAWLMNVDEKGLDGFQIEVLADFLMTTVLGIQGFRHPLSKQWVDLTKPKFWPEEARSFHDYCREKNISLNHIEICRLQTFEAEKDLTPPSLWSAREYVLFQLQQSWFKFDRDQVWKSLSNLKISLQRPLEKKLKAKKEGTQAQLKSMIQSEADLLVEILNLQAVSLFSEEAVDFLIDWKAGDLTFDFLQSPAFSKLDEKSNVRIWFRHNERYWDLKSRRELRYEVQAQKFRHVIRVQCSSGPLVDPLILAADQLTLIHHCQTPGDEWDTLFQGKLKRFLEQNKELAFLRLRPRELKRFLKWNPHLESRSWNSSMWGAWMKDFKTRISPDSLKPQGVWEVIQDIRFYSAVSPSSGASGVSSSSTGKGS